MSSGFYIFLFLNLLFGIPSYAEIEFNEITNNELKSINNDFTALISHTTVSPASGLLEPRTIEAGLIAGLTDTPHIYKLVKKNNPSGAPEKFPHAGVAILFSATEDSVLEFKVLPKISIGDASVSTNSIAYKLIASSPTEKVNFTAYRFIFSQGTVTAHQTINNASTSHTDVEANLLFKTYSIGAQSIWSHRSTLSDLALIEPYFSAGLIYSRATLGVEASSTASIFASESKSEKVSSLGTQFALGTQFHSFFFKCGAEISYIYQSLKYTIKISYGY